MDVSAEWVAIITTVVILVIGGFYSIFRMLNDNIVTIQVLKTDAENNRKIMDSLESSIEENTCAIWKKLNSLDARVDKIEIAHARQHDENLRG